MKLWRILEPPTSLFVKLVVHLLKAFWCRWEVLGGILSRGSHCRLENYTLDTTLYYRVVSHQSYHFLTFSPTVLAVFTSCSQRNGEISVIQTLCCLTESCLNVLMNFARSAHYGLPACFS